MLIYVPCPRILSQKKLFWRNVYNLFNTNVDYSDVLFLIQILTLEIFDTLDAISDHRMVRGEPSIFEDLIICFSIGYF